jgi:hypothetical protein
VIKERCFILNCFGAIFFPRIRMTPAVPPQKATSPPPSPPTPYDHTSTLVPTMYCNVYAWCLVDLVAALTRAPRYLLVVRHATLAPHTATMQQQPQRQQQYTAVEDQVSIIQQLQKQLTWSQGVLPHGWPAAAAPWVASSSNAQFIVSVVVAAAMGIVLHGSSMPVAPWCPMLSSTIHWLMS